MSHSPRRAIYLLLETNRGFAARLLNFLLMSLILANVAAVVMESVRSLYTVYSQEFYVFEVISVAIFTLEYALRIWIAPENPVYAEQPHPRLSFIRSGMAIIDVLAIAPFYLSMFIGIDTRVLRSLRLLRIFKLTRYSSSMDLMVAVLRQEMPNIGSAMFIMMLVIILSASGIYVVERDAQPEAFGSIPAALWWATVTLTTVGYGDVYPVTLLGRAFGMLIMLTGVGMAALPAGILASGYTRELGVRQEKFETELNQAMEDGVIDDKEREHLEQMKDELGIRDEEADFLKSTHMQAECPHCGKAFKSN
jgi:voltage-gated potassium channel